MAGSHRAPRSRRSPSVPLWAILVAIVVALVPATALTAKRVFEDSSSPGHATTDLPIPPVTPSATPPSTPSATPGASPTGTPTKAPTAPARKLPRISPAAPRRIVAAGVVDAGFDSSVAGLDASSDAEVARWDPRGSPGSPGTDTVYVCGRVRVDRDSAFADLPKLKVGGKVSIRTDRGTMTYTVGATHLKSSAGLAHDTLFTTHARGRLVLVGIRYDASGTRLPKVLVVVAQLSAAKRA